MTDAALWMMGVGATAPAASHSRLSVSGPYFVDPQGALVIRRSLTAFCLPKRYATGRADEANAYLDWAAEMGFNEVRAFSEVDWTGPPGKGVEPGWTYDEAACERTITEAAKRGMRVETVALTYRYDVNAMAAHLERVDNLCLRHDSALLNGSNEAIVNDIDMHGVLSRYTPRTPCWDSGVYEPTPWSAAVVVGHTEDGRPIYEATPDAKVGQSVGWHTPRGHEFSRTPKGSWEFGDGSGPTAPFHPSYKGPIFMSEPDQVEQTIRDAVAAGWPDVPDDWQSYAALCAFFGAGGLLHGNPQFQQCIIPTDPTVLACVKAFHAGFDAVPVQRYSGYSGSLQPPPSSNPGSRRYRRTGEDGRSYEITVRPFSFTVV